MNTQNNQTKTSTLSRLFLSAIAIAVMAIGAIGWWLFSNGGDPDPDPSGPLGSGKLVPFRTPGGSLQTNGLIKTEELRKETGSWRGTTSSGIRCDATYRYEIELRKDWNIFIDEERRFAFVVAPAIQPHLPVAVDSATVQTWTESGWLRFDGEEHLAELQKEMSPVLAEKAKSKGYLDFVRDKAKVTVEEFVRDWILKNQGFRNPKEFVIKVYFSDEDDIPYPYQRSLRDFLP